MRIVMLGAPGSGKGTQATLLKNKYKIPKISIGNILNNIIKNKSNSTKNIEHSIKIGKLIDDHIIISLIKQRIKKKDCCNGFLLDGFPRTIKQADAIKKIDIKLDLIFAFFVPSEVIIERITGRRVHVSSGRSYHIKFNPPKHNEYDDITGEKLTIRDDDQETVIRKRLSEYEKHTVPLFKYYTQENIIGNINYFKINGNRDINLIHYELTNIINRYILDVHIVY